MKTNGHAPERPRKTTIVHVVHGTWPHGFFNLHNRKREKAWFETDSHFLGEILKNLNGENVKFSPFTWSGKNSFSERWKAANNLRAYLLKHLEEHANAAHIIIAHSHGGNIAATALSLIESDKTSVIGKSGGVSKLICLATPFTHFTRIQNRYGPLMPLAIANWIIACILCILGPWNSASETSWFFIVAGLFGPLSVYAFFLLLSFLLARKFPPYVENRVIPPETDVYLLRSPRDEASLTITASQAIHEIFQKLFHALEDQRTGASWTRAILKMALAFPAWAFGLFVAREMGVSVDTNDGSRAILMHVVILSLFGGLPFSLLYVAARAATSWTVGFSDIRFWPFLNVEVETCPYERQCNIKAYSSSEVFESDRLRHGMHEFSTVRKDIANIITSVGVALQANDSR